MKDMPGGGVCDSVYVTSPEMSCNVHGPDAVYWPTSPSTVCFVGDTLPEGADVAWTLTCRVDVLCVVWPFAVTTYVWPMGSVGVPDSEPVVEPKDIPAGGSEERE